MNTVTIKGGIFDLDGTLVDSMWFWGRGLDVLLDRFFGMTRAELDDEISHKLDTAPLTISVPMLCDRFGSKVDPKEILLEMERFFGDFYSGQIELKPGVLEFLEHLKQKGVKMCVASASANNMVEAAMKHCGIDGYFEFLLTCDDVSRSKEYTDVYDIAVERLGTDPDQTWIFEDAVIALRTASKTSMHTVGIFDPGQKEQEEIRTLSEIYLEQGKTYKDLIRSFS